MAIMVECFKRTNVGQSSITANYRESHFFLSDTTDIHDDAYNFLFSLQMVSLLIGVIFYGQVLNQDGVMNMNGALFLFLTNMTFQNVFAVINVRRKKEILSMRCLTRRSKT